MCAIILGPNEECPCNVPHCRRLSSCYIRPHCPSLVAFDVFTRCHAEIVVRVTWMNLIKNKYSINSCQYLIKILMISNKSRLWITSYYWKSSRTRQWGNGWFSHFRPSTKDNYLRHVIPTYGRENELSGTIWKHMVLVYYMGA